MESKKDLKDTNVTEPQKADVTLVIAVHSQLSLAQGRELECLLGTYICASFLFSSSLFIAIGLAFSAWIIASVVNKSKNKKTSQKYVDRRGDKRLICYGNANELHELEQLDDVFFEPVIAQSSPYFQSPISQVWWFVILVVVIWSALGFARIKTLHLAGVLLLTMVCGQIALHYGWSIYYRVTPGALEVLSNHPLSRRNASRRTIPLGDSEIACRYDDQSLTITPQSEDIAPVNINLDGIQRKRDFVRAVFTAAVSSHSAPELPEDALLG